MGETPSEILHSMQTKEEESVSIEWPNHSDIFVENVWRLYSRGCLLDLDVECGEKAMGAHWVIMSALCELLAPPSDEQAKDNSKPPRPANDPCRFKLEFDGAANDQLCRCFIEFLYRGKTSLPKDSLQGFLSVLKQVGVRGLSRVDVRNHTLPAADHDSCTNSISEDKPPDEVNDENQVDDLPTVAVMAEESTTEPKDVSSAGQECVDHNYVESCPEPSIENTTEDESEEVVENVCSSVLKSLVEAVDEELSKAEKINEVEDDEVKELEVEKDPNDESLKDDVIVLDSSCENSPKVDNLVISEAVHCCSCSLSFKECDGRYFCLLENALRHCGCRLRQQETLTVLFDQSQPVESEAESCYTETECGQCSTNNIPVDVRIKRKHNRDTTRWYLDSYVSNMIDLSLSDGEVDDECVVTFDRSKAKKTPNAVVGRTATPQRSTRSKSAIFEKWCNLSQLKRNEPRKPASSTKPVSVATQTDSGAVPKESKSLEKEDIATLGDSFKFLLDKLDSETNLVCKLCRCKCSGVASFGLHMIATHHFVFSEKTETKDADQGGGVGGGRGKTILFCSYCDFRAVSQRLLACHLTDSHRDFAVTPGLCSRVTRESEKKRRLQSSRTTTSSSSTEGNVGDFEDEVRCTKIKSEPEDESQVEGSTKRASARIKYPNENEDDEEDDERDEDFHVAKSTEYEIKRKVLDSEDESPKRIKRRVTFASPPKKSPASPPPSEATTSSKSRPKQQQQTSPKRNAAVPQETHHCIKCGYETPSSFALKCHHLEHTSKSPFSCVSCREKFATKSGLMMHMMKHAKPNDYFTCTRCHYRTPWKGRYDAHLVKAHNIKVLYDCHICNKSCQSASCLDSHRRTCHYQKPSKTFQCPKCKHVAADAKQLYSHVFLKHISNT